MNEQANADLVLKLYAAFSRGEIQTILDHVSDDINWKTPGPAEVPYCREFHGRAGVAEFFQVLGTTQRGQKLTTDEVIAQDNKVVTLGRYACDIIQTGKHVDTWICHIFTIENGRVTRFLDLGDTALLAEAYTGAAVGVSR